MANNNSHTKDKGGGGEEGEAGTQDTEDVGTGTNWPMHANRQHSPINKVMECHKQEGIKDMEAGGGQQPENIQEVLQQLKHVLLVWF